MKATSRPRTAYHRLVRSFDHSDLAALPGYLALRQALGDIASQVPGTALAAFAAAVRDMAVPVCRSAAVSRSSLSDSRPSAS